MDKEIVSQRDISIQFKEFEKEMEDKENSKWRIKDEGTALWAADRIARRKFENYVKTESLRQQKESWTGILEAKIQRFQDSIDEIEKSSKQEIDFFQYHLGEYCLDKKNKDDKYKFVHPEVTVKFSTPQAKLIYDENKMYQWAKENKYDEIFEEKITPIFKVGEFKKLVEDIDGVLMYKTTGEPLEGVTKETFPRKVEVKI